LNKGAWTIFSIPPSQFKGSTNSTSSDRSRSNTQTKELAPAKLCSKVWTISADIDRVLCILHIMAIQVVEFSNGGCKIRKIFA
jgi:hypothetical protein